MRHSIPTSSVQEVPTVTAPCPDRPSSVQDKSELKREKRKQMNRESAKRSRLRKQYEYEQLQDRVHDLSNENHFLRKELQKVAEECNRVASENDSIKAELLKICGHKNCPGSD